MSDYTPDTKEKKAELKLPFTDTKKDMGEWAYDHRIGLCVTIIAYLALAISLVGVKIYTTITTPPQGIIIDMKQIAELEQIKQELEQKSEELSEKIDLESVKNSRSNEASEASATKISPELREIRSEVRRVQRAMAENRATYDEGVSAAEKITQSKDNRSVDIESDGERRDSRVGGNVTVSYSILNPTRHAQYLNIPAYRCKGGGQIIVEVELDRAGKVTSARAVRGGDDCMRESALQSAKGAIFNHSAEAPQRQRGTITYLFIPQ